MFEVRKGVSPLISYVLIVGIIISVVGVVLSAGLPMIENMRDTAAIQQAVTTLEEIDSSIKEVASGGKYTTQSYSLRSRRGQFHFDEDENSIYFEIESDSDIISSNTKRQIGNVLLSANTGVKVSDTYRDKAPCYLMENRYLETCIRKIPEEPESIAEKRTTGYWNMEGSEQKMEDISPNDNHGVLGSTEENDENDPKRTEGIHGKGLKFDGENDYVEIAEEGSLEGLKNFTMSLWINPSNTSNTDKDILWKGNHSSENPLGLWIDEENSQKIAFLITDSEEDYSDVKYTDTSIPEDEWTHIAVTFVSNEHLRIFINGEEDASSPFKIDNIEDIGKTGQNWFIGASSRLDEDNKWFNGTIDEVKIQELVKTGEEISYEYMKQGDESYINSSHLLVDYSNKKINSSVNPKIDLELNSLEGTSYGKGRTYPEELGGNHGAGEVTAEINSDSGLGYDFKFILPAGSDFLRLDVE